MSGHGIYLYADGVRYDGEYVDDKKDGFGIYYWTDGRKYEGYWYKGKQHGLGSYVDAVKKTLKYGLWEHGKRVRWFDDTEVQQINKKQLNYAPYFTEKESAEGLRLNAVFTKPDTYDRAMAQVKSVLNIKFI
jgi:hypothetical protein